MHLMTFSAQARPGNPGTPLLHFCYDFYATVDFEMLIFHPSLSKMIILGQMVEGKKTLCEP